ncbi:amidohydrolase [Arthrobacter sp. yr096]|uniref:M20 family metallopeptidase n=1 Tax=unclassified Arthrobacter TaxID=235627 RepID=UPI000899B418|nr:MULTISPECIES: M20 family metallopeptidase [unclassified Arthrobacter]SDW58581.1 amidohydrolase [Arthrobacter sp. cf158]SEI98718.1 amidohydrolase [Arthrobacter sp. yr096]
MTVSIDITSKDILREAVRESVTAVGPSILELSHTVHALAEISWEERQSAAAVAAVLREGGFDVTENAYGVPTAIEAVYGRGELTVVLCAEYDALPEVGHACGHNMIAAAGVGAALALKDVADAAGLRIKLLGTPAEEHGGGKVSLLQAGAWEDAAFSLMVHGMTGTERSATAFSMAAVERFEVQFKGSEAHAAGAPDKAINAGAAASLALMNMAVLRQHLPENANTNAFISHGGGATNVIAGDSTVQVEVRAGDVEVWRNLKRRVLACFEGAAIATGCTWTHRQTEHPYAPIDTHAGLGKVWDQNMEAVGRPVDTTPIFGGGSSDMGNVSQVVPSVHGMVVVRNSTAVPHHPDFTADAITPEADQAVLDGATVLAWTILDAALDTGLRAELLELQEARRPGATTATLEA